MAVAIDFPRVDCAFLEVLASGTHSDFSDGPLESLLGRNLLNTLLAFQIFLFSFLIWKSYDLAFVHRSWSQNDLRSIFLFPARGTVTLYLRDLHI